MHGRPIVSASLTWTVLSSMIRDPASHERTRFWAICDCGPEAGPTGVPATRSWNRTDEVRSIRVLRRQPPPPGRQIEDCRLFGKLEPHAVDQLDKRRTVEIDHRTNPIRLPFKACVLLSSLAGQCESIRNVQAVLRKDTKEQSSQRQGKIVAMDISPKTLFLASFATLRLCAHPFPALPSQWVWQPREAMDIVGNGELSCRRASANWSASVAGSRTGRPVAR